MEWYVVPFSISLLFFDCRLTAIQDRDPSSGDREDVIVKSEAIKTEMIGTVMPFPQARDRQRSMFPPSGYGNSQSSRDPRKRPSK